MLQINRSFPVQNCRPIRRMACRILTIRKTFRIFLFPLSFRVLLEQRCVGPKSPRYWFISRRLPSWLFAKNSSPTPTYTDAPISSFSSRLGGRQIRPRGSLIFWPAVVTARIAKIYVSDVARLMRSSGIADKRGWLMGGRKTKGCRLERCRAGWEGWVIPFVKQTVVTRSGGCF